MRNSKSKRFRVPLIGDPGIVPEKAPKKRIPDNLDLDTLSFEELKHLALTIGIKASAVCGINACNEHSDMVQIQRPPNAKYSIGLDVLYCNSCYVWFREKRPLT